MPDTKRLYAVPLVVLVEADDEAAAIRFVQMDLDSRPSTTVRIMPGMRPVEVQPGDEVSLNRQFGRQAAFAARQHALAVREADRKANPRDPLLKRDEVLAHMRAGWELTSSHVGYHSSMRMATRVQRGGAGKGGPSKKVTYASLQSLLRSGRVVLADARGSFTRRTYCLSMDCCIACAAPLPADADVGCRVYVAKVSNCDHVFCKTCAAERGLTTQHARIAPHDVDTKPVYEQLP